MSLWRVRLEVDVEVDDSTGRGPTDVAVNVQNRCVEVLKKAGLEACPAGEAPHATVVRDPA